MAINIDRMKEKLDNVDSKGGSKDNTFFRPEEGDQEIRILPSDDGDPFKEFFFHYNIGTTVMCPKKNFGERCPVCDYASSLWNEGTDEGKKMAKELFVRQRFFSNVLVRGKEEEGPKPYGYGKELYKQLIKVVLDPDYGDITDSDSGRDIKLSFEKAKKKGDFPKTVMVVKPVTKPLSKSKKEIKDLLDKIKPLDTFFERVSSQDVQAILEKHLEEPMSSQQSKYGNKTPPKELDTSTSSEIDNLDDAIDELD